MLGELLDIQRFSPSHKLFSPGCKVNAILMKYHGLGVCYSTNMDIEAKLVLQPDGFTGYLVKQRPPILPGPNIPTESACLERKNRACKARKAFLES